MYYCTSFNNYVHETSIMVVELLIQTMNVQTDSDDIFGTLQKLEP